jgi:hypothetical protein
MSRVLFGIDRCPMDPEDPAVVERWQRTCRRLGREHSPPTWATRVWRHVLIVDVDGQADALDTSWSIEFGTGHPPMFPPPKFPADNPQPPNPMRSEST